MKFYILMEILDEDASPASSVQRYGRFKKQRWSVKAKGQTSNVTEK
jgi:hypothetical protein